MVIEIPPSFFPPVTTGCFLFAAAEAGASGVTVGMFSGAKTPGAKRISRPFTNSS